MAEKNTADQPAGGVVGSWLCSGGHANDGLRAHCRVCQKARPCCHFSDGAHCGSQNDVHMYVNGPKCGKHGGR